MFHERGGLPSPYPHEVRRCPMTAPISDKDEVKRRTAHIIAEINQLREVEGLPPIYRQALDDARYQRIWQQVHDLRDEYAMNP